jgi:hypothetical protein
MLRIMATTNPCPLPVRFVSRALARLHPDPAGRRTRRAAVFLGLAALAATGMIAAGPGASAAVSCASSNGNHCYAEAVRSVGQNHGVFGEIVVNCLYMPANGNSASVTNEMWDASSNNAYWIEDGVTSGQGGNGYNYHHWFWADSRPGGGYHEHYPNISNAGSGTYPVEIYYEGNNSWGVIGGNSTVLMGTSTSQPVSSTYTVIAGTEYMAASNSGIRDIGHIASLEYQTTGGNWYYVGGGGGNENLGPGHYINGSYSSGSSTESWSGPC